MPNFKDKKTIYYTAGAVLVLIILIIWWSKSGSNESQDLPLTESASDPVELIIGREMLLSLEKMKSVKLDSSLFQDPVFVSLQDFSVKIPTQPIGRRDPFAPISQNSSIKSQ